MRILTRYVLREFLIPLFYCLTGFISIYILFELFGSFSRMMSAKISFGVAVRYLCGYLAPYFHYIAPAAMMLATLYTMWMFCRHSEIVAMRASGVSFLAIVKPLLAVSIAIAALVFYVNEVYVPRNAHWAAQMKTVQFNLDRILKADNIVLRNASANRTWHVDSLLSEDATRLSNVRLTLNRPDSSRLMNILAERVDYLDGEWWFTNPKIQHYGASGQEIATPTPELDALTYRCFGFLTERPEDFIAQNRPWKFNSVADRLRYLRTNTQLTDAKRREYTYDAWAQLLSPLACIIITLFAIPAGIASGRQSVFKGILGALAMYFSFYGVTIGCTVAAKSDVLNPILGAVLPGVVFMLLGIRAFLKQR